MGDEESCASTGTERRLKIFKSGREIQVEVEIGCRHVRQRLSVFWIPFENLFELRDGVVVFLAMNEIKNSRARS